MERNVADALVWLDRAHAWEHLARHPCEGMTVQWALERAAQCRAEAHKLKEKKQ